MDNNKAINQLNSLMNGGRSYSLNNNFPSNTGDLVASNNNKSDTSYSQIPEDFDSNNEITKPTNITFYPDDLGTVNNQHYVKFEVFVVDTNNLNLVQGNDSAAPVFDETSQPQRKLQGEGKLTTLQNEVVKYKKIKEMIGLPMPDGITSDHSTSWNRETGGLASNLVSFVDTMSDADARSKYSVLKAASLKAGSGISNLVSQLGVDGAEANLKITTKRASNPQNEFLFDGVNNRSFNFQWKFIPKSEKEAINIGNIIEKFKLYMYPELDQATSGMFYIFPALFDITFMKGNVENEWLYRTSTCALTNVIINYTPMGQWTAMENKTKPGAPFGFDVTLQFTETEFLHRARFKTNANPSGVVR